MKIIWINFKKTKLITLFCMLVSFGSLEAATIYKCPPLQGGKTYTHEQRLPIPDVPTSWLLFLEKSPIKLEKELPWKSLFIQPHIGNDKVTLRCSADTAPVIAALTIVEGLECTKISGQFAFNCEAKP